MKVLIHGAGVWVRRKFSVGTLKAWQRPDMVVLAVTQRISQKEEAAGCSIRR